MLIQSFTDMLNFILIIDTLSLFFLIYTFQIFIEWKEQNYDFNFQFFKLLAFSNSFLFLYFRFYFYIYLF